MTNLSILTQTPWAPRFVHKRALAFDYVCNVHYMIYDILQSYCKYFIWVREYSMGGGTNISGFRPHNTWVWENKHKEYADAAVIEIDKGLHTIHLFGRDDGFRCDQIILTTEPDFIPEGSMINTKFIDELQQDEYAPGKLRRAAHSNSFSSPQIM